jgi:hypothetical protein
MKLLKATLATLSLASLPAFGNEAAIPAYGMSCTAPNGASVTIIPAGDSSRVEITLVNAAGFEIASNIHRAVRLDKGSEVSYQFSGWLEMEQMAHLTLKNPERMVGAAFEFLFNSDEDLGMPKLYPDCDVI